MSGISPPSQFRQLTSGVTSVSGTYNMTSEDDFIKANTSGGAVTLNLPDASGIADGRQFVIVDSGNSASTNNITITPFTGQNINSLSTFVINQSAGSVVLETTGNQWYVVSSFTGQTTTSRVTVTQTAHGFTVGNILAHNGTQFVKALADGSTNSFVYGMVSSVLGANNFVMTLCGRVDGLSGYTPGAYYLSASTAGLLTTTAPTTPGNVSAQIFNAISATSGFFNNRTPIVVPSSQAWSTYAANITLVGGAGNVVPQYTTNNSDYCRIGDVVFVSMLYSGDGGNEGAGTGQINISLPIAANANAAGDNFIVGTLVNGATLDSVISGQIGSGATTVALSRTTLTSVLPITGADQNQTTRSMRLQFFYRV